MSGQPRSADEWAELGRREWWRARLLEREHDVPGAALHLALALELYVKAWLAERGATPGVVELLDLAAERTEVPSRLVWLAGRLPLYRHPADPPGDDDELLDVWDIASGFVDVARFIRTILPSETIKVRVPPLRPLVRDWRSPPPPPPAHLTCTYEVDDAHRTPR